MIDGQRLGRVRLTDGTGVKTVPDSAGAGFYGPVTLARGQQGEPVMPGLLVAPRRIFWGVSLAP